MLRRQPFIPYIRNIPIKRNSVALLPLDLTRDIIAERSRVVKTSAIAASRIAKDLSAAFALFMIPLATESSTLPEDREKHYFRGCSRKRRTITACR